MDGYEKQAYSLQAIVAVICLVAMFTGMIVAFPYGFLGLFFIAGQGILLIKVLSIILLPDKCNILLQGTIGNREL